LPLVTKNSLNFGENLLKITYSYNGAKFCGSQSQPNGLSVENALKAALGHVGLFGSLTTSSRTDKGVHALSQVSTMPCPDFWDLRRLKELINRHALPYIYIKKLEFVDENFHPRFSAKARSYRYILNHGEFDPFLADFCHFYPNLDINLLNLALSNFIGEHDFSVFMKAGSEIKSPVRKIYKAYAFRHKNLTIIKFKANGFLRSQVRLMVANALKSLNSGQKINFKKALTRIPAPPNGLYLERIFY